MPTSFLTHKLNNTSKYCTLYSTLGFASFRPISCSSSTTQNEI